MTTLYTTTKLPKNFLDLLTKNNIVINKKPHDITVIDITEHEHLKNACLECISKLKSVDIILYASFGNPLEPYIDAYSQKYIHQLLSYFYLDRNESLEHYLENNKFCFPLIGGLYQYKTGEIIKKTLNEIQKRINISENKIICDMQIIFADYCIVVKLISK